MGKVKTDKNELGKKKILNAAVEILEQKSLFKDESIDNAQKISVINAQRNALEQVGKTILMSPIKGKGGVISAIGEYKLILDDLEDRFNNNSDDTADILEAIDLQAYRIQNKLCERLFPDDYTYIGKRIERSEALAAVMGDKVCELIRSMGLINEFDKYANIYVYEEDEESLLFMKVIDRLRVGNFKAFVANNDAFKLSGNKVISFEEARITSKDALVFCAKKSLRDYDVKCSSEKGVDNILEVDLF